MADYYRDTEQGQPERRVVPSTRRLEFLVRASRSVEALQAAEIAALRSACVSKTRRADAVAARQGAQKRWAEVVDPLVQVLDDDAAEQIADGYDLDAEAEDLAARILGHSA